MTGPSSELQLGARKNESPQLSPPCRRSSTLCEVREVSRACVSPLSKCQRWESSQCHIHVVMGEGACANRVPRPCNLRQVRHRASSHVTAQQVPGARRRAPPSEGHPSRAAASLSFSLTPLAPITGNIGRLSSTMRAVGARVSGAAGALLSSGKIPSSATASPSITRPCAAVRHNGSDRSGISLALPSLLARWPSPALCSGAATPRAVQSCVRRAHPRWDLCSHRRILQLLGW